MTVERDLVPHFSLLVVYPRVRAIWQHLPLEILAYVLTKRHVLGIAQARVGLGFSFELALCSEHDTAARIPCGNFDCNGAIAEVAVQKDSADGYPVPYNVLAAAKQPCDL